MRMMVGCCGSSRWVSCRACDFSGGGRGGGGRGVGGGSGGGVRYRS